MTPEQYHAARGKTLNYLRQRRLAYRQLFTRQDAAAQAVMKDLVKFCHWGATPFNTDPRLTDVMIGRQQVMLRIKQHLGLSDEQLFAIYNGNPIIQVEEDENE